MKIQKIIFWIPLFCIIFSVSAFAKSPVWKISKNGNHLFVGGTIHMLSRSDFPLPGAFDAAFTNSDLLVLETDIGKFQSPEFQKKCFRQMTYNGEKNLGDYLKPDTCQALKKYTDTTGLPFESILRFKPGMLYLTLSIIEMKKSGQTGTGVDEFYNLKALNEKRDIKYLETAEAQLRFIAEMGAGVEDEFVNHMLTDLKNVSKTIHALKTAWKNGDDAQMLEIAAVPFRNRFPKIYHSLVVERNNKWIPQIEAMLKTGEIEFVLCGALHIIGKEGLVSQLEQLGYTVENM